MKPKITFTESALPFILEALGMSIDNGGYVTAPDGQRVHYKKIKGFQKDKGIIT
jgi:hypothetical protein